MYNTPSPSTAAVSTIMRIGVVGPESAGKTTITRALAAWYGCLWVDEYARNYLGKVNRAAIENDLLPIAQAQKQQEDALAAHANRQGHRLLICDTTQLVMCIWSLYQYARCHPWIEKAWQAETYPLQFLCAPDIPWQPDPLRGLPHLKERKKVFEMYENSLKKQGATYTVLTGNHLTRLQQATSTMESVLASHA